MSLIKCPECGKEISDKAKLCPSCGFPINIEENYICKINGVDINLEFALETAKNDNKISMEDRAYILNRIKKITNLQYPDKLYCKIVAEKKIPKEFNDKTIIVPTKQFIPKCPHCQSTNIAKISGTERAMSVIGLGILSKKINKSFKCKNCGYTW